MKLRFDVSEWTYRDVVDLEEAGFDLGEVQKVLARGGNVPVRLAVTLVWLIHRKQEPAFTLADAMALPMTEELDLEVVEVDETPKGGSGEPSSPPSVSELDGHRSKLKR